MLTDDRYALATKLAKESGLDQSQVMYAYLQVTATVAADQTIHEAEPEIDRRFQALLTAAKTNRSTNVDRLLAAVDPKG
ncbi:hypothetical protein FD13_GL000210 [Levilactobacillus senmaizukei DSM 21775 = NBRC 103853]|uniref:Uncharacterized protein n=2 Tax=Levilactobacillus senmaizukei TaxID=431273 RepID=A0A0R2DTH1_9LACO|nr:hypothetical protein FD13_GL000210 [Levilactobacillus senmaizukei DSM 21775 = NBRC 103853]